MHALFRNKRTIFLMVAPGLLFVGFAVVLPILMSIYYGMTDWNGMTSMNFIGLENYKNILFHDPTFWRSLWNAIKLGLGLILIQHPLCILFAILVDGVDGRMEKLFRTLFFVPCVISVVVTAKMWVNIYNYDFGLLNKVLDAVQLGFLKQDWLGNPRLVLGSLLVAIMWNGFGWGFLYYYAGMKGISNELHEAAKIDGCGSVMVHIRITIPLLMPVIRVNLVLAVISALKQMEMIMLTTNGGPGDRSQFLANYLYRRAFDSFEYGYGNAISFLFVLICIAVTVVFNTLMKNKDL